MRDRTSTWHTTANRAGLAVSSPAPAEARQQYAVRRCSQLRCAVGSSILLLAWLVSRRRLHLTGPPSLEAKDCAGQEVSGDHRSMRRRNRPAHVRPAGRSSFIAERLRRSLAVLQALAVPVSPARPGQETQARFDSSPGSKRSSTRQPKNSSWDSSTVTAVVSSQTTAASRASGITSPIGPKTSWDCSRRHSTLSTSPWTRSSKYIVSIYRKAATARLDTFVGPKDRAVPLNSVHYTA